MGGGGERAQGEDKTQMLWRHKGENGGREGERKGKIIQGEKEKNNTKDVGKSHREIFYRFT